jgi:hypothetical protein
LYFTFGPITHTGLFGNRRGQTEVTVGPITAPPKIEGALSAVTNASDRFGVAENDGTLRELPPGRYWIMNSAGYDLYADACTTSAIADITWVDRTRTDGAIRQPT